MSDKFQFRVYRLGDHPTSETAINNLRAICEQHISGQFEIEVVELGDNMQIAEDERIYATPTIERRLPEPVRRIVGDLSDTELVVKIFSLNTEK